MTVLNEKIASLQPSRSMVFVAKAKEMQKGNPNVINLAGGEPDFDTPARICEEAYEEQKKHKNFCNT